MNRRHFDQDCRPGLDNIELPDLKSVSGYVRQTDFD